VRDLFFLVLLCLGEREREREGGREGEGKGDLDLKVAHLLRRDTHQSVLLKLRIRRD